MALLDFLREKTSEIRIGIHPLDTEKDSFKYLYCFGLATAFCQNERVYQEVKLIFENIIDLLGLHENYKNRILGDVRQDFDYRIYDVFQAMDTKEKKFCFLSDLVRMEAKTLWGQSYLKEIIAVYGEVLAITKEEMDFLKGFFQCAQKQEMEKAIALYNEFGKNGNYISFKQLRYMYPSITLKDRYGDLTVEAGEKFIMDKPTVVKGTVHVKNGGSLVIHGAALSLYGTILVDGGKLDIRHSRIQVKECKEDYAIQIVNSAVIFIEDTRIIGNYQCGFVKQDCGHLIIRDSKLKCAGKERAVAFSGRSLSLIRMEMEDCQSGGISNSENSRFLAKECQFIGCVADHGGAIHSDSLEDVKVNQCVFRNCRAGFLGAAVYFSYKKYGQAVTDCILEGCEPEENIIYNSYMP